MEENKEGKTEKKKDTDDSKEKLKEGSENKPEKKEDHINFNFDIDETALVCQETNLIGRHKIYIGAGCVFHPTATINAIAGPVAIDCDCIFEERCLIVNNKPAMLKIGSRNVFEVACSVDTPKLIGHSNIFEAQCVVLEDTTINDGCVVGIKSTIQVGDILDTNTVVYGPRGLRRKQIDAKKLNDIQLSRHLEILRETLPKSHYLRTNDDPKGGVAVAVAPKSRKEKHHHHHHHESPIKGKVKEHDKENKDKENKDKHKENKEEKKEDKKEDVNKEDKKDKKEDKVKVEKSGGNLDPDKKPETKSAKPSPAQPARTRATPTTTARTVKK
eukprot:Platyproteum_vivax@DN3898_c0_g1_i2.p1